MRLEMRCMMDWVVDRGGIRGGGGGMIRRRGVVSHSRGVVRFWCVTFPA